MNAIGFTTETQRARRRSKIRIQIVQYNTKHRKPLITFNNHYCIDQFMYSSVSSVPLWLIFFTIRLALSNNLKLRQHNDHPQQILDALHGGRRAQNVNRDGSLFGGGRPRERRLV